ncbi:hypothetical protein AB0K14_19440 [Actinosynnema sp. NPDC050801]|uniref:hypothetical protein n=1 Tax=unclassified Actinosynnema TaxID=2637065 RepID=UPI0033D21195
MTGEATDGVREHGDHLIWINHLGFLPSGPDIGVSYEERGTALRIEPATSAETPEGSFVERVVEVPPGYVIKGVRLGYRLSAPSSFISQIRLRQLGDPPDRWLVVLDDPTDHLDPGPICVDSAAPFAGAVDPGAGALSLGLRVHFADAGDRIVLHGVGLRVSTNGSAGGG